MTRLLLILCLLPACAADSSTCSQVSTTKHQFPAPSSGNTALMGEVGGTGAWYRVTLDYCTDGQSVWALDLVSDHGNSDTATFSHDWLWEDEDDGCITGNGKGFFDMAAGLAQWTPTATARACP